MYSNTTEDDSFSTFGKFSENLTFITPPGTCAYQGEKMLFFGKFCERIK